jgi:polynucleotide 5'-hydroxyl-kinase GRC3/NOL9
MEDKLMELALDARIIMLIGATDTGKSTLAARLARRLWRAGRRCAVVDADVGQSDVGPPGSIGMGLVKRDIESLNEVEAEAFHFVGSFSPHGKIVDCVLGTHLMVERALDAGARHVIIDTTGYVSGPQGRALKLHKLDAVRPDLVILIQRDRELSFMLRAMEGRGSMRWVCVGCPPEVRRRGPDERGRNRRRALAAYLKGACLERVPLKGISILHWPIYQGAPLDEGRLRDLSKKIGAKVIWAEDQGDRLSLVLEAPMGWREQERASRLEWQRNIEVFHREQFRNRVVALDDEMGTTRGLGVINDIDASSQEAEIWVTVPVDQIKGIRFSWLRVEMPSEGAWVGGEEPAGHRERAS